MGGRVGRRDLVGTSIWGPLVTVLTTLPGAAACREPACHVSSWSRSVRGRRSSARADTHHAAALLDRRGALLSTNSFQTTTFRLPPSCFDLAQQPRGRSTSSRWRSTTSMQLHSCATCAHAGVRVVGGQPAACAYSPGRRARATRSTRRWPPACSRRQGQAVPEADRRDRRVDPAAARRAAQRGEVPQRRTGKG